MRREVPDEASEGARRADRRGIQSVETGMRVIEALRTSDGPQTLTELARRSGVPASNCHRYLVSVTRTGFVAQDPLITRYDFGPKLLQAGFAAMARLDPVQIGSEALVELVRRTRKSGLMSVWTVGRSHNPAPGSGFRPRCLGSPARRQRMPRSRRSAHICRERP